MKSQKDLNNLRASQAGKDFKLKIYQHELQVESNMPPPEPDRMPTRKAGDINTFSKSSRRRCLRLLNRIQTSKLSPAIFVSCTYRHGQNDYDDFQYKFHKLFLPKLKKILKKPCWLWRLEPHETGYPHFHLIIWSELKNFNIKSEYYKRQIRRAWRSAIEQYDRAAELYSCDIKDCDTFNSVRRYVSKYVAKEPDQNNLKVTGRRWGRSKNLPVNTISEMNITRSKFRELQQIVKRLLEDKGTPEGLIKAIMSSDRGMFVWLEEEEIKRVLDRGGLSPPLKAFDYYLESGIAPGSVEDYEIRAKQAPIN